MINIFRLNYSLSIILSLMILSCTIPEDAFENPLDLEANAAKGIYPPALVFSPDSFNIKSGELIVFDLYALAVDSVAGAQIEIDYFASSLDLISYEQGDFFKSNAAPIFIVEDKNGKLFIYVTFMGPEKTNISGTGNIATITFISKIQGSTVISVNKSTLLLNQNAKEITINGFGRSIINVK